jgi:ParB-like chromosome segregation protein Spo0J
VHDGVVIAVTRVSCIVHDDLVYYDQEEVVMKYIGFIKTSLLKERREYKEMFPPLSESEYADLRQSIREAGILDSLILEKSEEGYIILSGHHRKAIAEELGIEEVRCSVAETPAEIVEALFENAYRRQMTEAERKAKIREKEKVQDWVYEKSVIPEIYQLYKEGRIERSLIDQFVGKDSELQRRIFFSLSVEREVAPKELLEKHEREMAAIEERYRKDLDEEREKLAKAEAEKKKAEEALRKDRQELAQIRERAETTLATYEKDREEITEEVKREFETELDNLRKERERREAIVKAKQDEIAGLNGEIESFKNRIYGYESQVALWRHEIARVSELYNRNVAYYSNPALLEVQLQVISEYVESLVRFSECHKWDAEASRTVERYQKSIGEHLRKLVKEVKSRQKEVVSVEESEKVIAAQTPVVTDEGPKAS